MGSLKKPAAFTLIEVLTVMAIISVLVTLSVYGLGQATGRARDNTRKADLSRIKNTLLQYYTDLRTYPNFDTSQGRIYSAEWQLTQVPTGCTHGPVNKRLTDNTKPYLTTIPGDPKDKFTACGAPLDQHGQYLYLSSPAPITGPSTTPNGFALMATLEHNETDQVADTNNPLKIATGGAFAYYYSPDNYSASKFNLTANYIITDGIGTNRY